MLIRVYHASLHKIDNFEIPFNGLHMGTKESALQAVERKGVQYETDTYYLHEILIDARSAEDVFDSGDSWREDLQGDTSKVFSYTNKYEPSSGKSYVMFSTKYIKDILSVEKCTIEF
ncbi:hypothetical protein VPBG_00093 [Vibrio phage helene 12B3]|uniref:hypothetical protein n=1 Tax=Vibrio phage helene 12B3 TaxID=573173 RepID=UPI0002C090E3|nr:hypothetical protein VPBG_00093 [Vibrio phage helene 12B3]YP_009222973.1 hypothetical protein VPLG_00124 [Vibrio phage eugene 12A10]AGG57865.1 hypothetical protein VPBG_00093 [Vibrio phage helene 12B3]AGN51563.1 hypothetical protein VPLG_00124 [Vibrio phage eugene 12A10]